MATSIEYEFPVHYSSYGLYLLSPQEVVLCLFTFLVYPMNSHIRIPLISVGGEEEHIDIYPDELPQDHNDLIDILKSELAPFHVWRACATEYHRQGFGVEFDLILKEIVGALCVPDVSEIYKQREDYAEGITEIFVALAAKSLDSLAKSRATTDSVEQHSFYAKQVVSALESADEHHRMNEYTWIIKGFFEIMQGDKKRAEDHFRTVYDRASKGQNYALRKHLFVSLLGLGLVAYANQRYQLALDHFSSAINNNPNCTAAVRLVVACCCFKLGQYERSKLAAERAFALEPNNTNTLVLLALLEQALAKSGRSPKMAEMLNNSFEYCMVASALQPQNSSVLNMLANHYFHNWTPLPSDGVSVLDSHCIIMPKVIATLLREGDELRLNNSPNYSYVVASVLVNQNATAAESGVDTQALVKLVKDHSGLEDTATYANLTFPAVVSSVETKELSRVSSLVNEAVSHTSFRGITAESYYILGKLEHSKGNLQKALSYYQASQKESPDMPLSSFAIGQLLVAQKDFAPALGHFERILSRYPDDKDTQAYVFLLRGFLHKEHVVFEKLREIAPGFHHEADLWLNQGQLRLEKSHDHASALKCYMHAKDCLDHTSIALSPSLLSNIAVLNHNLGNLEAALSYSALALRATTESSAQMNADDKEGMRQPGLKCADLEGVFYSWSAPVCWLRKGDTSTVDGKSQFTLVPRESETGATSWDDLARGGDTGKIIVGDEVQIGGVLHSVGDVGATSLSASSVIKVLTPVVGEEQNTQPTFELRVREYFGNFNDKTLTYCYNHAYILEVTGRTKAASEIYAELLKKHPSFIECYIRLSYIAGIAGRFEEALAWLKRAQAINEEDLDVIAAMGDLYQHMPAPDHLGRAYGTVKGRSLAAAQYSSDAKKCFEKVLGKHKADPRAMLSMGNVHLNAAVVSKLTRKNTHEPMLKDSYKFFYHVLNADNKNAFGANGLGVICAEKGQLEAAKDIFFRLKEAHLLQSEDVACNLANVFLHQGRFPDAERLFQSTLKSLTSGSSGGGGGGKRSGGRGGSSSSTEAAPAATSQNLYAAPQHQFLAEQRQHLHECMALVQNRMLKNDESTKSLLHAIHLSPHASMQDWYNVAVVCEGAATLAMKKKQRTLKEILDAIDNLELAKTIFNFLLTSPAVMNYQQQLPIEKRYAQAHWNMCSNNLVSFTDNLERARADEAERQEERRRREQHHEECVRAKREELEKLELQKEAEKREKQSMATQKLKQLQELQDKWVAVPSTASSTSKQKKLPRKEDREAIDTDLFGDNDDVDSIHDDAGAGSPSRRNLHATTAADDDADDLGFEYGDTHDVVLGNSYKHGSTASAAQNSEIDFGSSDDEAPQQRPGRSSTTVALSAIDKDLFGDDDDDDDDDDNAVLPASAGTASDGRRLKRKVQALDDNGGETDVVAPTDTARSAPAVKQSRILADSDEEN